MFKIVLALAALIFVSGCRSAEEYNQKMEAQKSTAKLKSDVDFVKKKLERFHPQLYRFISKKDFDFKFDSLKNSITSPLSSYDFFLKLSPVVASIRQGHTQIGLRYKQPRKEAEAIKNLGYTSWFPFKVELVAEKLYIIKDNRKGASIKPGTEIVSINATSPREIYKQYKKIFSPDGYIETMYRKRFPEMLNFFFLMKDKAGDVSYQLRLKDSVWTLNLPFNVTDTDKVKTKLTRAKSQKPAILNKAGDKKLYSFSTKSKAKRFSFLQADSSVAMIQIANFKNDPYKSFYKESFRLIDEAKTKTLIIDLRNNTGGRLSDIKELYSYLVDTSFYFTNKWEFSSRTSILRTSQYLIFAKSRLPKVVLVPFATLMTIPPTLFLNTKLRKAAPNKYMANNSGSTRTANKMDNFKGKVYVLINGGSFSASSILSSNLKGSGRATFVGEETGGAENGCVAGFLPVLTLPHSNLSLRFGLTAVEPHYTNKSHEGRGIMPDVEIVPTIDDRVKKKDPELNWVLDQIRKK